MQRNTTGIDANSGPPSTMQMMRLAANSDFRQAAQKVVTELQKAGVDLTSQVRKFSQGCSRFRRILFARILCRSLWAYPKRLEGIEMNCVVTLPL